MEPPRCVLFFPKWHSNAERNFFIVPFNIVSSTANKIPLHSQKVKPKS